MVARHFVPLGRLTKAPLAPMSNEGATGAFAPTIVGVIGSNQQTRNQRKKHP